MSGWEIGLHWAAVTLYAASSVLFVVALVFRKERLFQPAVWLAAAAWVVHGGALAMRWVATGHGPYLRRYEVFSSDVWISVGMFLALQWRLPGIRPTGAAIMPLAFLFLGGALMASPEIRELPSTFRTYWLTLHIAFAKLAYGSLLLAAALATLYLLKDRQPETSSPFWTRIPSSTVLDELSYRLTGVGFVFLTVMIVAGAIWANQAWGSYWSWDPIETWSLISWLAYGIYLHLRRTFSWRGTRAAWFSLGALAILMIALFGIGILYRSTHSPYTG